MDFTYLKNLMDRLTDWRIPGNTALVYYENKPVFSYQSGYSDLEQQTPMTPGLLFNLYSASKLATVTAALQLYEQGLFLLDDPVYAFLPEFRHMSVRKPDGTVWDAATVLTLRHLFTMTSGFNYSTTVPAFEKARMLTNGLMDTRTVIRCLADEPLDFDPGTRWQYGLGHDVLAAVVEVISGQRFSKYVTEHIFAPLGMDTCVYHNEAVRENMAQQYSYRGTAEETLTLKTASETERVRIWKNIGKDATLVFGPEYDSGGAGVTGSAEDYARFASALANGGVGDNGARILAAPTITMMAQNQLTPSQMQNMITKANWRRFLIGFGYGLGVRTMVDQAASGTLGPVGEFGWGGAAGATFVSDPVNHLSLFYTQHMLNSQESYSMPRLRNALYACMNR